MAGQRPSYLTKSRYINGLSCRKWLWLAFNASDRLPKADESAQRRFDEGRQVGEMARRRFPKGELLPAEVPRENDLRSRKLLKKRVPLFEAGFVHPDGACYSRADVLLPAGRGEWDIVEVKSGGSVEEKNLHDVAFQRYCYAGAGLKIRNCSLLLVNTKYERSGEIDLSQFFLEQDVTDRVGQLESTVEPFVGDLLEISKLRDCPEFGQGEPFHKDETGIHEDDSVWKKHPGSDIWGLYRGGKRTLELLETGVFKISEIPQSVVLKGRQIVQHAAHTSGQTHVDREKIAAFLTKLRYPLHFLDFETFNTAVPLFDRARPYQQIPFQFSVHVVKSPGQKPLHHSHLSMEAEDPRKKLLIALQKSIGPKGSVVAYNQGFEKGVLTNLAALVPEHAKWVDETNERFVDLLVPFREFAYYNPAQSGSASLKAVLPAITGQGYEGFEIANGGQASLAYLSATFGTLDGTRASPAEVEDVRKALERYCGRDTEGLGWIVEKLAEFSRGAD